MRNAKIEGTKDVSWNKDISDLILEDCRKNALEQDPPTEIKSDSIESMKGSLKRSQG